MRIVDPNKDKKLHEFAKKAYEYFYQHPTIYSFTEGKPTPGKLLALRWNDYCVMVFMIDDTEEILIYKDLDLK